MIYPLTEKQREIVDYADDHSYAETAEKFGIGENSVRYLREKRNRIEKENVEGNGILPVPAASGFARVACSEGRIEVRIGGVTMAMTASDLAEVIKKL